MLQKAEVSCEADSENYLGGSSETLYYIGHQVLKFTLKHPYLRDFERNLNTTRITTRTAAKTTQRR